jgi:hypothetical protein
MLQRSCLGQPQVEARRARVAVDRARNLAGEAMKKPHPAVRVPLESFETSRGSAGVTLAQ